MLYLRAVVSPERASKHYSADVRGRGIGGITRNLGKGGRARPHLLEALAQLCPDAGVACVELSHHPLHRRPPLAELTFDPVNLVVYIRVIHGLLPFCWCYADCLLLREDAQQHGPHPFRALALGGH
jgi:hypothetical protein